MQINSTNCAEGLEGKVRYAKLSRTAPKITQRRYSGARAAGVRYEKKAQKHLNEKFPDNYLQNPWLQYILKGENFYRWCQPDGLLIDILQGRITCIEIKHSHTPQAWWQLKKLYLPVLRKIFPARLWEFDHCEVVRWYDRDTAFPEKVALVPTPVMLKDGFKVHIWHP